MRAIFDRFESFFVCTREILSVPTSHGIKEGSKTWIDTDQGSQHKKNAGYGRTTSAPSIISGSIFSFIKVANADDRSVS